MTPLLPKSEREIRSSANRNAVLSFLRDETWSTAPTLQRLLQHRSRQATHKTLLRLEREGLLRRHPVQIGVGRPIQIWGITTHGLAHSYDLDEKPEHRQAFEPSKLRTVTMSHHLDLQTVRIAALHVGWSHWHSSKGLRLKQRKAPDAVATRPDGCVVAIEVERHVKTKKRYQEILVSHLLARKSGEWQFILYLSPTLDLAARVRRIFNGMSHAKHNGQNVAITAQHLVPFHFDHYEGEWATSLAWDTHISQTVHSSTYDSQHTP